jgi:hypothetical protein
MHARIERQDRLVVEPGVPRHGCGAGHLQHQEKREAQG